MGAQGLEGVWLACACWVLATATDEDAEYMYWLLCNATRWRKSSRNGGVQVSPQRQGKVTLFPRSVPSTFPLFGTS